MTESPDAAPTQDALGELSLGQRAGIGRVEEALFGREAVPVHVGRFEVRTVVGRGAFGVVYAAADPELGREVALKVLSASEPAAQAKLQREARLMATVADPHVVTVYEVGTFEQGGETKVFVAMEFVVGMTLRAVMREPAGEQPILELLLQAGRGLVAAHAAGVVHRDFKPDNVLVGNDGRVRVVDFGLASTDADGDPSPTGSEDEPFVPTATRTRGLAGTPVYMAPELFDGEAGTQASDQFSYCVTVYEALVGRRPFEGKSLAALATNVASGPPDPPAGTGVEPRVQRVLERGLQPRPGDRYPSMTVLLAALEGAVPRRSALRIAVAVGGLAAAFGAAAGVLVRAPSLEPVPPCAVSTTLETVWTPKRRALISAGFVAADEALGRQAWTRASGRAQAFTERWVSAAAASCERTTGSQEAKHLRALEAQCLGRARVRLEDLLTSFETADAPVVAGAVRGVRALPDPHRCLDTASLLAAEPEEAKRARVAEAMVKLDRASSHDAAGRYEKARSILEAVVVDAEALDFGPLMVEAQTKQAQLDLKSGRYPSSHALAREAFNRAVSAPDHRAAIAATVILAQAGVADPRHLDEGLSWVETGRTLLERVDDAPRLRSSLAMARASLLITAVDTEHASGALEEAVQALRTEDSEHPELAAALGNWGTWLLRLGKPREAIAKYVQALRMAEQSLGPAHPEVAQWLLGLGSASITVGDFDAADDYLNRSLALHRRRMGEGHPNTIQTWMYLGVLAHNRRAFDEGLAHFERALESAEQHLGADHPLVAEVCLRFADTLSLTEDHARAQRVAQTARTIYEAMLPADDVRLGPVYAVGMVTAGRAGRTGDAIALGRRGLVVTDPGGDVDPLRVNLLHELGRILLEDGQRGEATMLLQRASAALAGGVDDLRRQSLVQFDLARARLPDAPDVARAHALEALALLPAAAPAPERDEIEAWLDDQAGGAATVEGDGA